MTAELELVRQTFCLGASASQADGEHHRPIYVHAKGAIIDDLWVTVGSANLNNRGLRDDVEINVATLDAGLALRLRLRLWAEHLGLLTADEIFALNVALQYHPLQVQQPAELGGIWQTSWSTLQNTQGQHVVSDRKTLNRWQDIQKTLHDPVRGIQMMHQRAEENLLAYKARQPLVGHLVPYLLEDEARQQDLNFREEHGW
jgi:phosphatidylserine/phosphatidylglycerophosphate/cardiolipin synthase-like enzyme